MKYTINSVNVRPETEFTRHGEPKKNRDKIYIWIKDETIIENLQNRRNRPYKDYKREVIPQLMEWIKDKKPTVYELLKWVRWGWDQHCGCSMCPCSPGFVGDIKRLCTDSVHTIHVDITVTD